MNSETSFCAGLGDGGSVLNCCYHEKGEREEEGEGD